MNVPFVTGSEELDAEFVKAAEKAGSKPEECLVLEDSEAGIQAAYAAGIPVICIPDLKQPREEYREKTTAVMDSLTEIIGYLEGVR
jgi:beta-phosphoglucomutase-like phosphatase (HAD superfamily)